MTRSVHIKITPLQVLDARMILHPDHKILKEGDRIRINYNGIDIMDILLVKVNDDPPG